MTCKDHPRSTWTDCSGCFPRVVLAHKHELAEAPVFKAAFPGPMRFTDRDIDLMGEAQLRILVKRLLTERNGIQIPEGKIAK